MLEALGAHADAWDRLVVSMPLPSPFLRSWWLGATAAGDPRFVLVFDGDELLGGLALQRTVRAGVEILEFLGTGPLEPDHLDLVSSPERARDVTAALRRWFGSGDRIVDLDGVRTAAWVLDAVPGRGRVSRIEVAPHVSLPASADEYLASRGGRTRSTVTRSAKRLAKAGIEFRVVGPGSSSEEIEAALGALRELHDGRWGDASGFLAAWDRFAEAARRGVAAGDVRFHLLVDTSEDPSVGPVVAVEVEFVVGGRMSFYQAGRLTDHELRGSGSVLRYQVVSAAIADGCTEFDLLRGGEDYKAEWADQRRELLHLRRGTGPRSIALVAAAEARSAVLALRAKRAARSTER